MSARSAARDYVDFLKGKVALVEAMSRSPSIPPTRHASTWSSSTGRRVKQTREMRKLKSPLGTREEWNRPTVLLGSAGLNLAVCWKLKGGSGCTCLDPLAYDLREHEIFERPGRIDRSKMISIPTPADFSDELKAKEIEVLPLVADIHQKRGMPGWCTHALDFARLPDVEFFCGGVNSQTPTSAGLWRQGNLLHFGFEQSPAGDERIGQATAAELHRLYQPLHRGPPHRDHPVGVRRPRRPFPRDAGGGGCGIPTYPTDFGKDVVAVGVWAEVSKLTDREAMAKWADDHSRFFYPDGEQRLAIDEDLAALNIAFDQPEFFVKTVADLRRKTRPQRLGDSPAQAIRADGPEERLRRRMGPVAEGKPGVRLRLRCGRLSVVHRPTGEEAGRARRRDARPATSGSSLTGSLAQRAITRPAMRPEHGGRVNTEAGTCEKGRLAQPRLIRRRCSSRSSPRW